MKVVESLRIEVMTEADIERVAKFHAHVPELTPAAFAYEYFANPNTNGRLFFAEDDDGQVMATQAFVARDLILDGRIVSSLMSERTLLAKSLRGKVNYAEFYAGALEQNAQLANAQLVWGGTAARKAFERFGFIATNSIFADLVVLRTAAIVDAWKSPDRTLKSRALHTLHRGYAHARRSSAAWRRARPTLSLEARLPSTDELRNVLVSVSRSNPTSYFLHYTPTVIDWLISGNKFKQRKVTCICDKGHLVGLAAVEERSDGFAHIVELLLTDTAPVADALAALIADADTAGSLGVTLWGNCANGYVGKLRQVFRSLGSVASPTTTLIVQRAAPAAVQPVPDAASLAMTGIWSAPV